MVGQPNVGKSTIMNSIVGKVVVSASPTPGHTKYFQTYFLTRDIRLCDCPGLIFPSLVPRALQVWLEDGDSGCKYCSGLTLFLSLPAHSRFSVVCFLCLKSVNPIQLSNTCEPCCLLSIIGFQKQIFADMFFLVTTQG